MAFYEDCSTYEFFERYKRQDHINIGWLERAHPFETAVPTGEFLDTLWEFCKIAVVGTRGIHCCDLCEDESTIYASKNETTYLLGVAEIRVFGENNVFACPNLIYHYVEKHHYRPPETFIKAVYSSPKPDDEEFIKFLDDLDLPYSPMRHRDKGEIALKRRRFVGDSKT